MVNGFKVISVKEFEERWNTSGSVGCPKVRSEYGVWLYPLPEDPCKSGDCGWILCHNYKKGFSEPHRLVVPERPLLHLLKEHLKNWTKVWPIEYRDIKFWAKVKEIETIFDKLLEEVDSDG